VSRLADRLRGIVRPVKVGGLEGPDVGSGPAGQTFDEANDLDGEWRQAGRHRFLVIERSYPPGHRHGSMSVADGLPPEDGWARLPLLGGSSCGGRLLFVDLETTGLAGGAGTYAFLVGCAWFDGGRLRVRQFLLSSFAAERALLEALGEVVREAATVVTYNGKTFDLPLIETRHVINRLATPFASMPHIDLLHPARRLWRGHDEGHRLVNLEQWLLGHERDGDVPGFEIPARYFRYVRSGDAAPLHAVLEHNRLDLVSLALLTARMAQLLEEGVTGARTAHEAFGLGRLYERAGLAAEALACFARAADGEGEVRAAGLRAMAVMLRRARQFDRAAEAWQRLLDLHDCPPHLEREAAEALAVHHEHRLGSPLSAHSLALRTLRLAGSSTRRQATEHRVARLESKLSRTASGAAALF
jgi:uncharacterized protein YprB with RNaseH-like and TPR domain